MSFFLAAVYLTEIVNLSLSFFSFFPLPSFHPINTVWKRGKTGGRGWKFNAAKFTSPTPRIILTKNWERESRKCQIFPLTTRFSSEIFTIHWPLFISFLARHKFSARFGENFQRQKESGKASEKDEGIKIRNKRWTIAKFRRIVRIRQIFPPRSFNFWFRIGNDRWDSFFEWN